MPINLTTSILLVGSLMSFGCSSVTRPASPASTAAELLATDSAFSVASARTDAVSGLSAMFAAEVAMPAPGGKFAEGAAAATELLRSNPDNLQSRAEWTPVRVGISGDGFHGFTFGYGTLTRPDSSRTGWKYLSYWVKGPSGWRVVAYRRGPRPDSTVSLVPMPAALPAETVSPADSGTVEKFRASLDQAERSFSDEAQQMGLGPAFVKWGRADAVNMGGPTAPAFIVGSEAIGAAVGRDGPASGSPVSWAPDRVVVAASGDLGVTIGVIRPNLTPPAGSPPGFAFFTIWYRATPADPWRYIAE